jgi:hypothetical protein
MNCGGTKVTLSCGDEVFVRDINGATLTRFVWQCGGRWLALQRDGALPPDHPLNMHNGYAGDWRWLLAYLMKAARLAREGHEWAAVGGHSGWYIQLGPVVRVSELAGLIGMPPDDVRAELADYVIQVSE